MNIQNHSNKLIFLLFWLFSASSFAQNSSDCPRSNQGSWVVEKCFEIRDDGLYVKKQAIKNLVFNKKKYAFVQDSKTNLGMHINKSGKLVLRGILFSQVEASDGTGVFISDNGKCGYFDNTSQVIIQPKFDSCKNFSKGLVVVCNDCKSICSDADCHSSNFFNGTAMVVNKKSQIVKSFLNPSIENFCPAPGVVINHLPDYIDCRYTLPNVKF